jgi:acetyltransferase-like isoleucine patch superfamily enzyme
MILIEFLLDVPWGVALWLMMDQVILLQPGDLNALESVIFWFSDPRRVGYHALSRVLRVVATPLVQLVLGIIVKRCFGLNTARESARFDQLYLLRRYISVSLLSREKLKAAFSILGTHYEVVSYVYRAMGAKIGKRVYWPGSSLVCDEPELLEIGNDVVFGSRSELFTSDTLGSAKIRIGNGAMIADRCVLLPGTTVGHKAVMGSGALSKRNGVYENGSTWMGNSKFSPLVLSIIQRSLAYFSYRRWRGYLLQQGQQRP